MLFNEGENREIYWLGYLKVYMNTIIPYTAICPYSCVFLLFMLNRYTIALVYYLNDNSVYMHTI